MWLVRLSYETWAMADGVSPDIVLGNIVTTGDKSQIREFMTSSDSCEIFKTIIGSIFTNNDRSQQSMSNQIHANICITDDDGQGESATFAAFQK